MIAEMDDEGFLVQPDMWTRGVAESIATAVLPGKLEDDHWKVIDYLRDYFSRYNTVPPLRMLCKGTGVDLPYLRKLFPCGLINGACKIAGLPRAILRGLLYP
ncbi:MAG TPA: TusE/DsrC/DsvC family sulfur relay protein [Syntrophorhabdales bacterium]|nr:TusE/DsrC/DsvC family sulfur relay protein [Syntrophorhabdales bacterium]